MIRDDKIEYIVCPKCGREYLPAEIYLPNSFLGKPRDIHRLNNGKIESFEGQSMILDETYICDACSTNFRVTAKVQFKTSEVQRVDFSKYYVTSLFEDKFTLTED